MRTEVFLHGKLEKTFGTGFEFTNIFKPKDVVKALNTKYPSFAKEIIEMEKQGMYFQIVINGKLLGDEFMLEKNQDIQTVEIAPCIVGSGPVAAVAAVVGGAALMGGATILGLSAAASFALGVGLLTAGITFLMSAPDNITPEDQEASVRGDSFYFSSQANASVQGSAVPLNYGLIRVGSKVVSNSLRSYDRETRKPKRVHRVSTKQALKIVGGSMHNTKRGRDVRSPNYINTGPRITEGYRATSIAINNNKGGKLY